jgi:hypothetical protein
MSLVTEPEKAVSGIKGGSPRFKSAKEELPELSRIYIQERNAKMAAQRRGAEIDLALREATLIPRRRAKMQLGFLLTGLRQRLLSFSYALPRRLAGKPEHDIGRILDAEVRAALRDIASWPEKLADPAWAESIAPDLEPAEAAEANGHGEKELGRLAKAERKGAAQRVKHAQQREKRKRHGQA